METDEQTKDKQKNTMKVWASSLKRFFLIEAFLSQPKEIKVQISKIQDEIEVLKFILKKVGRP